MVNAIVDLIQSFIGGSFDTLKGLLKYGKYGFLH